MKTIVSATYTDNYLYFLPLITWGWNKLGIDVICFMPVPSSEKESEKLVLAMEYQHKVDSMVFMNDIYYFIAPEHKKATYAQCSRLYGSCLDLPEDEILITSDVDMLVFNPLKEKIEWSINTHGKALTSFGYDLVSENQRPICYAWADVAHWRLAIKKREGCEIIFKTYQEYLDFEIGMLEAEHFRGNFWCRDQEILGRMFKLNSGINLSRAKQGTQFAINRIDRTDSYWYDRLSFDNIDYHCHRPGYEGKNFEIIMKVLQYHYPDENFQWLINYTNEYKKLL